MHAVAGVFPTNLPGERFCAILSVNNEMPMLAEVYKMLKVGVSCSYAFTFSFPFC